MERRPHNRQRPAETSCGNQMDKEHQTMFNSVKKMVTGFEALKQPASNQSKQVLRQEVESQVLREYQEREAQMRQQMNQMSADLLKLHNEKQSLLLTLAEAHTVISSKDAALQQSEDVWQAKYEALSQKSATDIEANNQKWEMRERELAIGVSLVEEQLHRGDLGIIHLTDNTNSLIHKLEIAEELNVKDAELLQRQTAWEAKFQTLTDNFCKLKKSQQSMKAQQTKHIVKVEAKLSQRDAEILRLTEDNNCLVKKLAKTTQEVTSRDAELLQSQTSWQAKYTALEKVAEDLTEKQQSLEREVTQLVTDKTELEDLCLYINKKRRRFLLFPRRSSDSRQTQLLKIKIKMQQKAAQTRGDEEEEEEMEDDDY